MLPYISYFLELSNRITFITIPKTIWITEVVEQATREILAVFCEGVVASRYLTRSEDPADHVLDGTIVVGFHKVTWWVGTYEVSLRRTTEEKINLKGIMLMA